MAKYQAVLFDLDGTLIDTNHLIVQSFLHTLEVHTPGQYTEKDILAIMGEPLLEQMKRFDQKQAEKMVETYQQFNVTKHDELVREFPKVRETVQALSDAGFKLGVVTNKRRKVVEMGLRRYGLDRWMKTVICAGEGIPPKPEPDMIQKALSDLQVSPESALMVGDTRFDVLAGKRAGVDQVGVGWSLHPEQLKELSPTYFIEEMNQLLEIVEGKI